MLQQCVCRDIEHLGSLENTQKARVAPISFAALLQNELKSDVARFTNHE